MPSFSFQSKLNQDAQTQAKSLSAWTQSYDQLSSGRFEGRSEELQLEGIQIFHERASQTVLQIGTARPKTLAMAVTNGAAVGSSFCGHKFYGERMLGMSSQRDFELVASAGMSLQAVCIDTDVLTSFASSIYGPDYELQIPPSAILHEAACNAQQFGALLRSVISLAQDTPALLDETEVKKMLRLSLVDALLHSIDSDQLTHCCIQ